MSSLALAVLLHATIAATGDEGYAAAHRVTAETGKPLMVMVTTDWCAPCQTMKNSVIPQVRRRGLLGKVAFATVNPDQDRDLAQKITGGGPVPQLVMFRRTRNGWWRRKLIGGQSVEKVEAFINEGVAQDDDAKTPAEKQASAPAKPGAGATAAPTSVPSSSPASGHAAAEPGADHGEVHATPISAQSGSAGTHP